MKKKPIIFLAIVLIVAAILTWLMSLDDDKESTVQEEAPKETITVADTAIEDEAEETSTPLIQVSNSQLNKYKSAAEDALSTCKEIYAAADKGTSSNVVLSDSVIAEMISTLGANGYSAIDYFCSLNMQNAQPIIEFGSNVNAGINGEACYYVLHSDGTLHANNLIYKDGVANVVTVSVEWDNNKPSVYSTGQFALSTLKLTEKGWLICTRDSDGGGSDWSVNGNAYTFVRLYAYDSYKAQLAEKYMGEQPYYENNLFTCTWSASDFSQIDFNSLFMVLYSRYYGTQALTANNLASIAGFSSIEDTDFSVVPYEQFERVITHYIDISSDTLRWYSDTSSQYNGYIVLGTSNGIYNNNTPKIPSPEITDYWYNSDGSLTMKIDAVYPSYGTDKAFTHELTVMDTSDGFKYVSNYVYESDSNIFPNLTIRSERKNQIALIK
jgi:hypothetical protein